MPLVGHDMHLANSLINCLLLLKGFSPGRIRSFVSFPGSVISFSDFDCLPVRVDLVVLLVLSLFIINEDDLFLQLA